MKKRGREKRDRRQEGKERFETGQLLFDSTMAGGEGWPSDEMRRGGTNIKTSGMTRKKTTRNRPGKKSARNVAMQCW